MLYLTNLWYNTKIKLSYKTDLTKSSRRGPDRGRLSLSTDGDKCAMVNFFFFGGGMNKKFNINFNIQNVNFVHTFNNEQ